MGNLKIEKENKRPATRKPFAGFFIVKPLLCADSLRGIAHGASGLFIL